MAARRSLAGLSEIAEKAERARKWRSMSTSLLIFEPEGIIVSVKLDSCYRSFSSFSCPGSSSPGVAPRDCRFREEPRRQTPGRLAGLAPLPFRSEEPKGKFSSLQSFEKSQNGEGISPEPREENKNPRLRRKHFTRGGARPPPGYLSHEGRRKAAFYGAAGYGALIELAFGFRPIRPQSIQFGSGM